MPSEDYEGLKALQADREQQGRERRKAACDQSAQAQELANDHGMALMRFSKVHYRLVRGKDSWELYPGNQRIIGAQRGRFLVLPTPWDLIDVVNAAIDSDDRPERLRGN